MAIPIDFVDLFQLLGLITPFLIILTFVLISIFNNRVLNGLIYLVGILLVSSINVFLSYIIQKDIKQSEIVQNSKLCSFITFPFSKYINYKVPYINSTLIAFTIGYIIIPTFFIQSINTKYILGFIMLFALYIFNSVMELICACCKLEGIILGTFVGLFLGVIYNYIVKSSNSELVYLIDSNNKTQCGKTKTKKTAKCHFVDEHGNPIPNLNK